LFFEGFFASFGDPIMSASSFFLLTLDWGGDLAAVEVLPLKEGEPRFFGLVELGEVLFDPSQVCTVSKGLNSAKFFILDGLSYLVWHCTQPTFYPTFLQVSHLHVI
jgi:hypothetical protein